MEVFVANRQVFVPLDHDCLVRALKMVWEIGGSPQGEVSVALVDDDAIADLHMRHMNLPEPTDVLSFVLSADDEYLEGEIVASAETAAREATRLGWPATSELLLYVVHGALHLVGFDDIEPIDRAKMRVQERVVLESVGIAMPPGFDEEVDEA